MSLLLSLVLALPAGAPAATSAQGSDSQEAPSEAGGIELFVPTRGFEPIAETTIGMRVLLEELVVPGSEVRPVPVPDPGRADVILRVINSYSHGSDNRYNLEVTPYIEGDIDLRDYLERVDGSSMDGVPELIVLVDAVLPEEVIEPNELEVPHPNSVGGYRALMIALGVLWFLGLLGLLFVGRKKSQTVREADGQRPLTLADRLRPLVESARAGTLEGEGRAELERVLLAHWRERRNMTDVRVAEAVSLLRSDDEAGPLFRKLEEWLHRPADAGEAEVDVAALLAPYESVRISSTSPGGGAA